MGWQHIRCHPHEAACLILVQHPSLRAFQVKWNHPDICRPGLEQRREQGQHFMHHARHIDDGMRDSPIMNIRSEDMIFLKRSFDGGGWSATLVQSELLDMNPRA